MSAICVKKKFRKSTSRSKGRSAKNVTSTVTSTLKKKLWKVFSLYIRKRDKYTCVTCGRKGEGSGIHAGHYIPRSKGLMLYFHERNVHAQCYDCNINLGGNGRMYERFMLQKYGQKTIDELERLKYQVCQAKEYPFEDLIAYYDGELKNL